ncbi:MAG: hypothetical protein GY855_00230 [candidate division Zixibacteria bacterium]|nr:hypothetical protein [candidate division Zixibacteria bacterium]
MDKKIKKLLYLSFDSELTKTEKKLLENALAASEELRNEKNLIEKLRETTVSEQKDRFKPFFAERVMQRIESMESPEAESEQFFASMLKLFKPIAVVGVTAVFILTAFNIYKGNDLSLSSVLGIYEESSNEFFETPLESFLGV